MRTLFLLLLFMAPPLHAQVRVLQGPTPIPGGNARAPGDLTVMNERLAFALAVESVPPYGVPRGALVDLAPVAADGGIAQDKVAFADFIPNNWSAWPNRRQQVRMLAQTAREAVVETVRDWGDVSITTVYTLRAGEDQLGIHVTMTNNGGTTLADLRSGVTLWQGAGYMFGVPGLEGVADGPATAALSRRTVAYDEGWSITLHAPYLDHVGYGGKDLYQTHTLKPGESRGFEAWLQVTRSGDLAPVTAAEIARRGLPSGTLTGAVTAIDGKPVPAPVVVIEQAGKPYAWTIGDAGGRYRIALPEGDYSAYATGKAWSQTAAKGFSMHGGGVPLDFTGLQPPGAIHAHVLRKGSQAPLDARIAIAQGQKPLVEFLGRRTWFTELDRRGEAAFQLAPGNYVLSASFAGDVLAAPVNVDVAVESGRVRDLAVPIEVLFEPRSRGWHAADLHHHADQAEAVTPAPDVVRSQLAAGLDLLFVSDHDSLANHARIAAIAKRRGVPFIPGVEISASWAHFNAYPVKPGTEFTLDTSTADVDAVYAEAHRLGADVVQVNHPLIPYGYFTTAAAGVAPGGFNPAFDVVEVNSSSVADDDRLLQWLWEDWNAGRRHYLAAGSDTHDVWNGVTGSVRTYAHVDGSPDATAFARALKAGHAYVTYGPLVYPDLMFGDTIELARGQPLSLGFDLQAVSGLKKVSLVSRGAVVKTLDLSGRTARVEFPVTGDGDGWYALVVEDAMGRRAYTNPLWIAEPR